MNFLVWDWAKFSFDYLTTLPQILETLNKYTTRIQIVGLICDAAFVWGKIRDLSAIGEILRWKEQALKSNLSICNFIFLEGSPCVFARWAGFCNVFRLLGLCDFPFQKKNKGNVDCWLHSHCCRVPHQFWTGSKICSSGSSATSRLYCWYFVTLARLLLLPCYNPYKKQSILYIAANNFLDHDLILFRIYSASGEVLEGDDGLLSGWD